MKVAVSEQADALGFKVTMTSMRRDRLVAFTLTKKEMGAHWSFTCLSSREALAFVKGYQAALTEGC